MNLVIDDKISKGLSQNALCSYTQYSYRIHRTGLHFATTPDFYFSTPIIFVTAPDLHLNYIPPAAKINHYICSTQIPGTGLNIMIPDAIDNGSQIHQKDATTILILQIAKHNAKIDRMLVRAVGNLFSILDLQKAAINLL